MPTSHLVYRGEDVSLPSWLLMFQCLFLVWDVSGAAGMLCCFLDYQSGAWDTKSGGCIVGEKTNSSPCTMFPKGGNYITRKILRFGPFDLDFCGLKWGEFNGLLACWNIRLLRQAQPSHMLPSSMCSELSLKCNSFYPVADSMFRFLPHHFTECPWLWSNVPAYPH